MKLVKALLLLTLVSPSVIAQTRSDIFDITKNVTWFGLDFTEAKLIGDRERMGSESDVRYLIDEWNEMMIKEAEKFNIAASIGRKKVENAIAVTEENNRELDVLAMFSDSEKDYLHLNSGRVAEIIAGYDYKGHTGIGLMFNIESFNKLAMQGSMWVTFINIDTKEVLFTTRMIAEPGGSGVRNNWVNTVFGVMEKMKKKEFELWSKLYYRP